MRKSRYRCKWCRRIVWRASTKAWVKSFCEATGKRTHLMRAEKRGVHRPREGQ